MVSSALMKLPDSSIFHALHFNEGWLWLAQRLTALFHTECIRWCIIRCLKDTVLRYVNGSPCATFVSIGNLTECVSFRIATWFCQFRFSKSPWWRQLACKTWACRGIPNWVKLGGPGQCRRTACGPVRRPDRYMTRCLHLRVFRVMLPGTLSG